MDTLPTATEILRDSCEPLPNNPLTDNTKDARDYNFYCTNCTKQLQDVLAATRSLIHSCPQQQIPETLQDTERLVTKHLVTASLVEIDMLMQLAIATRNHHFQQNFKQIGFLCLDIIAPELQHDPCLQHNIKFSQIAAEYPNLQTEWRALLQCHPVFESRDMPPKMQNISREEFVGLYISAFRTLQIVDRLQYWYDKEVALIDHLQRLDEIINIDMQYQEFKEAYRNLQERMQNKLIREGINYITGYLESYATPEMLDCLPILEILRVLNLLDPLVQEHKLQNEYGEIAQKAIEASEQRIAQLKQKVKDKPEESAEIEKKIETIEEKMRFFKAGHEDSLEELE
jgi:hypothetical protein